MDGLRPLVRIHVGFRLGGEGPVPPTGGILAPSQCRMMLSLCEGTEIYKDRLGMWDDVYGERRRQETRTL